MCTADLKPPAVDNCSAFRAKQTVPGTAGDITPPPDGMEGFTVSLRNAKDERERKRGKKKQQRSLENGWMDGMPGEKL